MSEQPTAMPPEMADEELVAYLDGELGADHVEQVEQRLATDSEYRRRLKHLQRVWDLLDDLPRAEASDTFTQSTVSLVALRAVEPPGFWRRHRAALLTLLGSLAVVLAASLGFAAAYAWYDAPNRKLLRDLPLIENWDAYHAAGSIEFLRALEREKLFEEDPVDAP